MRFRLWSILWVFALFSSAMALFHWVGIIIASFALLFWGTSFFLKRTSSGLFEVLIALAIGGGILGISLMHTGYFNSLHRREWCLRQMQDLAFAIKHYSRRTGELPRDFQTPLGRRLTWRIRLLPDLGARELVEEYGLNSEWDGENLQSLSQKEPFEIRCHAWGRNMATAMNGGYFAIVGDETYWMDETSTYRQLQADYDCDTVMLIEANPKREYWFEAHDLTMEEAINLLTSVPDWENADGHKVNEMSPWRSFFYKPSVSRNVAMADGSVRSLYTPLPKRLATAILTKRQDEMDRRELDRFSRPQLDYGKMWALSLFMVLLLLPGIGPIRRHLVLT